MIQKSFLIPPSSHFLKTLVNYLLSEFSFTLPEISKLYVIFPTQRSAYFFKNYLIEKLKPSSIFLPKILSWEEFLLHLYLELTSLPKKLLPEEARPLFFIKILNKEKFFEDPKTLIFLSYKFLEVFDEFEREGKIPTNLLYPPNTLPEIAQALFEELSETYKRFKALLEKEQILFPSLLLSEIRDLLIEKEDLISQPVSQFMNGLVLAGFAALRTTEKEILQTLSKILTKIHLPTYFFFSDEDPPHPIIQKTLYSLNLETKILPKNYWEIKDPSVEIKLFSFPDPESEVSKALELIQLPIKEYDKTACILPLPIMLLPLSQYLEKLDIEANITLPFPSKFLGLWQFFQLILKAQREKTGKGLYLSESVRKIFNLPFLRGLLRRDEHFEGMLKNINKNLEKLKLHQINLDEFAENLDSSYRELFEKLVKLFFKNFESLKSARDVKEALTHLLELAKPYFESVNSLEEFLNKQYLAYIEGSIFELLDFSTLWEGLPIEDKENFYLTLLEILLGAGELSLFGEPLAGLQIMGFLESRLLYFDRILVFDVNEGSLPPSPEINPLLTDEIKRYLGLPIFKNELWDYYFDCLIKSGREINLLYISTPEGKGDLVKEPSRYILKLKWQAERGECIIQDEAFKMPLIINPPKREIPKRREDQETIQALLNQRELSRSFFETYLLCPVKFYFQYLLGLKPLEESSLKEKDIGNFLHNYFETFFGQYLGKTLSFREIPFQREWEEVFEKIWSKENLDRSLDPLSLWLTKKLAKACIKRYLEYLAKLEEKGQLSYTQIMGLERELRYKTFYADQTLSLYGRIDFIVKRKENDLIKYILFDFKTNPYKKPYPNSVVALIKQKPPSTFNKEDFLQVRSLFGSDLSNFQLLFYLFLFLKNASEYLVKEDFYSLDTGFLTPANLEEPERMLLRKKSPKMRLEVEKYLKDKFEGLLHWIITHILESQVFYIIDEAENCKHCPYKSLCQNLRK